MYVWCSSRIIVCNNLCMYVFVLYLLNPLVWSLTNYKIYTALCIEIEKKLYNFQLQASYWAYFKSNLLLSPLTCCFCFSAPLNCPTNRYIVKTLVPWACCFMAFRIRQLILNAKYCCLSCSRVRSSLILPLTLLKNPWPSCFKKAQKDFSVQKH